MFAAWSALDGTHQVLWGLGIFSTMVFAITMVLTFAGLGHDHDLHVAHGHDHDNAADHDHDVSPARFFTFRNGVAFAMGLSFGALMLESWGLPIGWAIFFAVGIGVACVAITMAMMGGLSAAASSGTIDLDQAVGKQGEVTVLIPPHGTGYGKMMLAIGGGTIEIEAYSAAGAIGRGTRVRVIRNEGHGMLFVEPVVN